MFNFSKPSNKSWLMLFFTKFRLMFFDFYLKVCIIFPQDSERVDSLLVINNEA
jgi:hypothetical protein